MSVLLTISPEPWHIGEPRWIFVEERMRGREGKREGGWKKGEGGRKEDERKQNKREWWILFLACLIGTGENFMLPHKTNNPYFFIIVYCILTFCFTFKYLFAYSPKKKSKLNYFYSWDIAILIKQSISFYIFHM